PGKRQQRKQIEDDSRTESIGPKSGYRGSRRIAGMVEHFIAPDPSGESAVADDAKRHGRKRGWKDHTGDMRYGLRDRNRSKAWNQRERKRSDSHDDGGNSHRQSLGTGRVDQR